MPSHFARLILFTSFFQGFYTSLIKVLYLGRRAEVGGGGGGGEKKNFTTQSTVVKYYAMEQKKWLHNFFSSENVDVSWC